jgi:hypothetical protein
MVKSHQFSPHTTADPIKNTTIVPPGQTASDDDKDGEDEGSEGKKAE